jgi:hypothetical protein
MPSAAKKEKPFGYLPVFSHMSEFEPEFAKQEQERVWKEFAKAAGVDIRTLRRAYNRIVFDGYYGPLSDEERHETEDHGDVPEQLDAPMTMHRAQEILRAALDHNPEVKYTHPDHGWTCEGSEDCHHVDHEVDDGPLFHEEPLTIEAYDLKKAFFGELIKIYGSLTC